MGASKSTASESYTTPPRRPTQTTGVRASIQGAPPVTISYSGGGFAYIPVSGEVRYKVVVIKESRSGMNLRFLDKSKNREMTSKQFCDAIRAGEYPGYYVRGGGVPVSRPNTNKSDNLG